MEINKKMFFPHAFRMLSQRITQFSTPPPPPLSVSLPACLFCLASNFHSFSPFSAFYLWDDAAKRRLHFYSLKRIEKSKRIQAQTSAAKLCTKLAGKRPKNDRKKTVECAVYFNALSWSQSTMSSSLQFCCENMFHCTKWKLRDLPEITWDFRRENGLSRPKFC